MARYASRARTTSWPTGTWWSSGLTCRRIRFRIDDDDVALGEQLLAAVGTQLGNDLFVVTDASWRPDVGPFVLPAWHLSGLVRDHLERIGEPFFASDVVILSPDEGVVVAVHRAGLVAVAHGRPSPRQPVRVFEEFLGVVGVDDREVMRLPAHP